MKHTFKVEIEKCPNEEGYTAICAKLGIVTQGKTIDEAIENVSEILPTMLGIHFEKIIAAHSAKKRKAQRTRNFTPNIRFSGVIGAMQVQVAC